MNDLTPIQTKFDGHHFRSRCEARWAYFLKELGLQYEYEPEGFELGDFYLHPEQHNNVKYLPDFYVQSLNSWVEVKGPEPTQLELKKCSILAALSGKDVLIAVGAPIHPDQSERDQIIWIKSSTAYSFEVLYDVRPQGV